MRSSFGAIVFSLNNDDDGDDEEEGIRAPPSPLPSPIMVGMQIGDLMSPML